MSVYGFVKKGGRKHSVPVSSNLAPQNYPQYDGKSTKRTNEDISQPAAKRPANSHREDHQSNLDIIQFPNSNINTKQYHTNTSSPSSSSPHNKKIRQIALPSSLPPDSTTDDLPTSVPPREYWLLKMRVTDGSVNIMDYWDKCGKRWDMEGLKQDLENVIGAKETTTEVTETSSIDQLSNISKNKNNFITPKSIGEIKCSDNITGDGNIHRCDLNLNNKNRANNDTIIVSHRFDGNGGNGKELNNVIMSNRRGMEFPDKQIDKDINEEIANWMLEEDTER